MTFCVSSGKIFIGSFSLDLRSACDASLTTLLCLISVAQPAYSPFGVLFYIGLCWGRHRRPLRSRATREREFSCHNSNCAPAPSLRHRTILTRAAELCERSTRNSIIMNNQPPSQSSFQYYVCMDHEEQQLIDEKLEMISGTGRIFELAHADSELVQRSKDFYEDISSNDISGAIYLCYW